MVDAIHALTTFLCAFKAFYFRIYFCSLKIRLQKHLKFEHVKVFSLIVIRVEVLTDVVENARRSVMLREVPDLPHSSYT